MLDVGYKKIPLKTETRKNTLYDLPYTFINIYGIVNFIFDLCKIYSNIIQL
jgi:hypothetical protein